MSLTCRIDAVTVYRRGAEVRRVADLGALGTLPNAVTLGGLPLSLEDASVRVRIEGADGAPVARDARVALDVVESTSAAPPPDERALREARLEEARLGAVIAQAQDDVARLSELSIEPRPRSKKGEAPRASPTESRLALLELRRSRVDRLLEEIRAVEKELRRARDHRIDLEERWQRASTARGAKRDELRKAVVVTLGDGNATGSGHARLILEYTVPGARWAPAYSLRIAKDGKRAELALRAVVCQKSGEDWTAVPVSLSTADAQRFTELPELESLRIGRAQPRPPRRGWRPLPAGAEELFADYDRTFRLPPVSPPVSGRADAYEEGMLTAAEATAAPVDAVTRMGTLDDRQRVLAPRRMLAPSPPASRSPEGFGAPASAMTLDAALPKAAPASLAKRPTGMLAGLLESSSAEAQAAHLDSTIEIEQDLGADSRMLAYGDLRMPGPDQPGRGTLTLASRLEVYVAQQIHVTHEMLEVVDRELAEANEVAEGPPPPRHRFPSSQAGFDYAYRGDAPVDVPSDGHFHAIPLLSTNTKVDLRHVVVPRESQDVFRFAEIPNPLDAPLLEGPADVYLGDDYLLTTDLHVTPPRGKLRLGLGVDSAVKASRNTSFVEQSAGLMGGSLTLRHAIDVELVNHRKEIADVEVRERIPILRKDEDDIKLEVGDVEPAWEPYEQEEPRLDGGYRWRVRVEPGERRRLRASYSVKIAAKNELVGGNRRER